jgi:hypothetical protein
MTQPRNLRFRSSYFSDELSPTVKLYVRIAATFEDRVTNEIDKEIQSVGLTYDQTDYSLHRLTNACSRVGRAA